MKIILYYRLKYTYIQQYNSAYLNTLYFDIVLVQNFSNLIYLICFSRLKPFATDKSYSFLISTYLKAFKTVFSRIFVLPI